MRTNIDINDDLLAKAMKANVGMTKKAVVEKALLLLVQIHAQTGIRKLRGKVQFYDDVIEEVRLAGIRE